MNKSELIRRVSAKSGYMIKDTEAMLSVMLDEITSALAQGESVRLSGFGTFEPHERAERTARNPKTNAPVTVAPSRTVRFRPGRALHFSTENKVGAKE